MIPSIRSQMAQSVAPVIGVRHGSFSPQALFAIGQQGAWYDPSDLSTLFQDAAGTIPVTGTGQPVGLMLDKSGRGNHASQATAASRPIFRDVGGLRYLECDGVDDGMVTGNIDFTGTDKMFVCAGLRTLSTVTAAVVELSVGVGPYNGTFLLAAHVDDGNNFRFRAKGTLQRDATSTPTYRPPVSVVAVGQANIPGDTTAMRLNGTPNGETEGDLGTGNFGNYPLYLFRRGGATLPFNGIFYGAIIAGAAYSASQIASAERYLAGKSGVTV